jgi:type I restriction enzyme, R subunit
LLFAVELLFIITGLMYDWRNLYQAKHLNHALFLSYWGPMPTPEALARQNIDSQLAACGWVVQDRLAMNLYAGRGVAVREFPLETGYADYLLFVDRKVVGVVEAKAEGIPLAAVSEQAAQYAVGLPVNVPHVTLPLPFLYESTGVETFFRDNRDPEPRSRRVFSFHRPETLADWLTQPETLRLRLRNLPPLIDPGRGARLALQLWDAQVDELGGEGDETE